jgi:5-methylcytosine-specific restriction endonuclease McrA
LNYLGLGWSHKVTLSYLYAAHSVAHINEMFQCQLCKKTFDTKTKFKNHAIKVHGKLQYTFTESDNNKAEFKLLEREDKEEKARKRTRGPNRKSSSFSR